MTLYTLKNLIEIACVDVSSSELVILLEIKVRMPFKNITSCILLTFREFVHEYNYDISKQCIFEHFKN